jgi:hypothetical protein
VVPAFQDLEGDDGLGGDGVKQRVAMARGRVRHGERLQSESHKNALTDD